MGAGDLRAIERFFAGAWIAREIKERAKPNDQPTA